LIDLSLSRLPGYGQLALFVVLSLSAAGAYYYYVEIPTQERLAERDRELANLRGRISKGLATARQLPAVQQEVAELHERLERSRKILPDEKDAADLLRRVHTLAELSHLTIRGFRPQATNSRPLHAEWPIGLELEGTYHNLGAFLDRVSKVPQIINISGLVIRSKQQPQPNATVDITCTATTFVLLDGVPSAPALAPPPGAPALPPVKKE
jgi:type IV pilus assembly protein PilO